MKKAFTLIELLVVIAIIAILAAILFPVFAQAKAAAKKTQGLSNQKQVSLGITMYIGDVDDTMPIDNYSFPGGVFPNDVMYWPQAVSPYVKSWPLFKDPNESTSYIWGGASNVQWWYNYMRWPHYGYNWGYFNLDKDCSQFDVNPPSKTYYNGPPVSATVAASPAGTVLITDSKVAGSGGGYYTSELVESPAAATAPGMCTWADGGWGIGAFGDAAGQYAGNPTSTGIVAPRQTGGMNVGFLDGHAKYYTPGNLAAGTNWRKGINYTAVQITDKEKYLWDLE